MQVRSAKGKFVDARDPIPLSEAREKSTKVGSARVICTWYNKHAKYTFTYDGPVDDKLYPLENALGLVDLALPDSKGKQHLRDPSQGPQLDAALELTKPAQGKKRTQGEEMLAHVRHSMRGSTLTPRMCVLQLRKSHVRPASAARLQCASRANAADSRHV